MKLANLQEGEIVTTLGYNDIADGGESQYEIMTYENWWKQLPDIVKLVRVHNDRIGCNPCLYRNPVDEYGNHTLNNGLVAKLIVKDNVIKVEQYGCIEGRKDNCQALIHLFGNVETGEIIFGKDKTYEIYYNHYSNNKSKINSIVPEIWWLNRNSCFNANEYSLIRGCRLTNKPALGCVRDLKLIGNNCTIHIPDNEFCYPSGSDFAIFEFGGQINGLEISGFNFDNNAFNQFGHYVTTTTTNEDGATEEVQTFQNMRTCNHTLSYFCSGVRADQFPKELINEFGLEYEKCCYSSISQFNGVHIHDNVFLANGTMVNSNDCGGDGILIINPTECNDLTIEDNEFYDWGRWVFSIDLGGNGERFYNVKFNRNKCIQTVNNYIRGRADANTYRSYRGLGWIDFEARKCFTNLEVCDNIVEGACGFAINGNGKVTENVVICRNTISRPNYNEMLTEEEKTSGLTVGWRGVYNYGFNWYSMYGKNVLFEDNILNYGGVEMVQGYNITFRNNVCADWVTFGGFPLFGEILLDGNTMPGSRSTAMNFNFGGTPHTDFGIEEPYTHVVVNNHNGGGFYGSQRTGLTNAYRPVTLEFTGNNRFNKMDLNVFGYAEQVEFNPQWMNPDVNFAIRGAKFTAPTTRKYNLSYNWQSYYTGFIGGGYYNEGEIVYQEDQYQYVCTESGYFPSQSAFLLVDDHEIYYERATEQEKGANTYIFTFDNWYIVTTKGKTGTVDNFPHHTKGSAMWGEATLLWLGHVGKIEKMQRDVIEPLEDL